MLTNISFLHPLFLIAWCIISVFFVYVFLRKSKKYNFLAIADIESVYKKNSFFYILFFLLVVLTTLMFWLVLATPVQNIEKETIKRDGVDIEIVFDTSYSMIAQDLKPSRMEVAKKVVSDFIAALETDRVWIILFSGKPFSSVPLSFDYDFLRDFLSEISVQSIDQSRPHLTGTAIGDALVLAADSLEKDNQDREKVIILMTDGEANRGLDPILALKYLKEEGIKTYTIGVGKDEQTTVDIIDAFGFRQRVQIGGIDEETLKKIAIETGGKYYRADSQKTLDMIFEDIQQLEKKEIEIEKISLKNPKTTPVIILLLFLSFWVGYFIFFKKIDI